MQIREQARKHSDGSLEEGLSRVRRADHAIISLILNAIVAIATVVLDLTGRAFVAARIHRVIVATQDVKELILFADMRSHVAVAGFAAVTSFMMALFTF